LDPIELATDAAYTYLRDAGSIKGSISFHVLERQNEAADNTPG